MDALSWAAAAFAAGDCFVTSCDDVPVKRQDSFRGDVNMTSALRGGQKIAADKNADEGEGG